MRITLKLIIISCACSAGGCAYVSRDAATKLSHAGVQSASTLSNDVQARIRRLEMDRAAQDFVAAYNIMSKCPSVTRGNTTDADCDSVALADARAKSPVNVQIGLLADVLIKRSRALTALRTAYSALGDEAAYDAPGELDTAIAPALDAVNEFGSAVGLGAIPAFATDTARLAGHALAARAQQRRLIEGSQKIGRITQHMRLALEKERDLFGALDVLLGDLDSETQATILKANLLDPSATVKAIMSGVGLTISDEKLGAALSADPRLNAAAEVATLDGLRPASSGDLEAGIALLRDLEAQHDKFERGERPDAERIATDAAKLADLMTSTKK